MKKVLICLLAALLLCGCAGQNENSLDFPKVTYAKRPMVTLTPEPTPTPLIDFPSKVERLSVMDAGYDADVIACNENTMLVADTYSRDYQLVWLKFAENIETPMPIERRVIREDREEQEADETKIYDLYKGPDGFYYVLLGEMPPYYIKDIELLGQKENVVENKDYAGRYRIEKYDMEGKLWDTLYLTDLPVDSVSKLLVLEDGSLFILAYKSNREFEGIRQLSLDYEICLLLDGETGEIMNQSERDRRNIYSLCTDGQRILASFDDFGGKEAGFGWIDPESGEATEIPVTWNYGIFGYPYCVQGMGQSIMMNNQLSFGWLSPEDNHTVYPILNSIPDDSSPLQVLEETPFSGVGVCCQYNDQVFVVALNGYPELWVFSPA